MNSMSMKKVQQGFTLIELMIVVAIIGILAAVAIPAYQDYTIKAKIGNALTAVDSVKTAIALCVQEHGGVLPTAILSPILELRSQRPVKLQVLQLQLTPQL